MFRASLVTSAMLLAAITIVVIADPAAAVASPHPFKPRVIELSSSGVNDFSDIGQNLAALPDGGFAVVWVSLSIDWDGVATGGTGILQLVAPDGRLRSDGPIVIAASDVGGVWSPAVIADDEGGVFTAVIAQGEFVPGPGFEVLLTVQHFDAEGRTEWPGHGVEISDDRPGLPVLVADDAGGCYVCFVERSDVVCQRVDSDGGLPWGNDPVPVSSAVGDYDLHGAVRDGAGGVIVVWTERVDGGTEIRAQRLDRAGVRHWGDTGTRVATTNLQTQRGFDLRAFGLADDDRGGVVVTYEDDAGGSTWDRRLLVQHLDRAGLALWPDPVRLGADDEVSRRHRATVADGAGGVYVVSSVVDSGADHECRVTRLTAEGRLPWGRVGRRLGSGGCAHGQAAFGHGLLAVVTSASRVFVLRPDGEVVGPTTGGPSPLPPSADPADVIWSVESLMTMTAWEVHHQVGEFVDVVGMISRIAPPPPRRPRRRGGALQHRAGRPAITRAEDVRPRSPDG